MELKTIKLSEIKGLDKRVRTQMSPEKLEELEASIREEGQLVPIKVRKNGAGYTLVFGHRRVQAAKAAGLKTIEALVANVPDEKLLTQSLIENVVREDMDDIDVAKALRAIIDQTGCTPTAIGKRLGWSESTSRRYLDMLDSELGLDKPSARMVTYHHAEEAKAGTHGDLELAGQVLQKSAREELSTRDTRKVAEVAKRAQDFGGQKAVHALLKQQADVILRTYDSLPKRKPAKPQAKPGREIKAHFSWLKDPRSMLAEEGLKAVSVFVSAVARSQEARGEGKMLLKSLRKQAAAVLKQIDAVLEDL